MCVLPSNEHYKAKLSHRRKPVYPHYNPTWYVWRYIWFWWLTTVSRVGCHGHGDDSAPLTTWQWLQFSILTVSCVWGLCVVLTLPHAPSPINTILSCLSWLSSSESDMTLNCCWTECLWRPETLGNNRKLLNRVIRIITIGLNNSGLAGKRTPFWIVSGLFSARRDPFINGYLGLPWI